MKIVRIFSRLNIGGPSIHVVELSHGLNDYEYETTLITGELSPGEGDMSYYATEKGITPIFIKHFQAPISPLKDLFAFFSILRQLIKIKPDIVHTHTFKAGLLGRVAAFVVGTPIIVHTYHGHVFKGYYNFLISKSLIIVEKALSLITDKLICVSDGVCKELEDLKVSNAKKLKSIPLGFDLEKFKTDSAEQSTIRQKHKILKKSFVIGFIGRFVPIKNINLLLESSLPLLDKYDDIEVVLLGDGPCRAELEAKYKHDRIHFCGWIKNIAANLKDIDLLICCSINEGTSVSVIEALLSGIKVISTPVGGMLDLGKITQSISYCESNKNLFESEILKEYHSHIRDEDKSNDQKLWNHFSKERLFSDIDKTYKSLI